MADNIRSRSLLSWLRRLSFGEKIEDGKTRDDTKGKIDSFCVVPWKHLHMCDSGEVRFCCATPYILDIATEKPLNIYENTIDEIWNSAHMRKVRQAMVRGEAVPDCAKSFCAWVEASGGRSRRMAENDQWKGGRISIKGVTIDDLKREAENNDFYVKHDPIDLDLEVSNLCNLACRMCSGDRSSKIENDSLHGRWVRQSQGPATWTDDVAIIGPQPFTNVVYINCHEYDGLAKNQVRYTKGAGKIIVRNIKKKIASLAIRFSSNMPFKHQVTVRANGETLYSGCPLDDGLFQSWKLEAPEPVDDLVIEVECSVHMLEEDKLEVGVGIEYIELKSSKKQGQVNHRINGRLSGQGHWMKDKNYVYDELLRNPKRIKKIQYIGGEPLINKEVLETFDYLKGNCDSKNIIIEFTTNGTIFDENVFGQAGQFEKMVVAISLDGIGTILEYIRYPAKWLEIEENIKRIVSIKNIYTMVSSTMQAYNALNVVDLFRFCDSYKLPIDMNMIRNPIHLSVSVLPPNVRRIAVERLHNYAQIDCNDKNKHQILTLARGIESMGDRFDPQLFRKFMLFTNDLDQSRGQNLRSVNGELIELIEEGGLTWTDETFFSSKKVRM